MGRHYWLLLYVEFTDINSAIRTVECGQITAFIVALLIFYLFYSCSGLRTVYLLYGIFLVSFYLVIYIPWTTIFY